jgi:hypothetical protein
MIPAPTSNPTRPALLRFEIRDLLGVVVGYAMAAALFRAFWPASPPPAWVGGPASVFYVWLGLTLSGPLILLCRRAPSDPSPGGPGVSPHHAPVRRQTWAESIWMFVGIYWIALGLFVIPIRLHTFGPGDALLFGLLPFVGAWISRRFAPKSHARRTEGSWTHGAAVVLLLTWPVAWGCMIVMGRWMN